MALLCSNSSIASLIESHQSEHIVPFREIPLINPKRRSIYFEQQDENLHRARSSSERTTGSSSVNSRSQSMPKLIPSEHHFTQQNPSSRSSSPKSFSVNSDQGFTSESNSHLSSGKTIYLP